MRKLAVMILFVQLLAGCESIGIFQESPTPPEPAEPRPKAKANAESLLKAGVREFEDGNYVQAERLLRSSLGTGLAGRASRARASLARPEPGCSRRKRW